MIKFINWFIRPLGYVCVDEGFLEDDRDYVICLEKEITRLQNKLFFDALKTPIGYEPHTVYIKKPEYKDNVMLFNKLV